MDKKKKKEKEKEKDREKEKRKDEAKAEKKEKKASKRIEPLPPPAAPPKAPPPPAPKPVVAAAPAPKPAPVAPPAPKPAAPAPAPTPAPAAAKAKTAAAVPPAPAKSESKAAPKPKPAPEPVAAAQTVQPEPSSPHTMTPRMAPEPEGPGGAMPSPPGTDLSHIHHVPFISEQYNQTYVYALPRNSRAVYVFYEVSTGTRDHLKERFGQNFFEKNFLVMRVRRIHDGHTFDVQDFLDAKNNYWLTLDQDTEYEVEIGYRAHGTTFFEHVATSNKVRTQGERATGHEAQNETRSIDVQDYSRVVPVDDGGWRFNYYEYWKQRKVSENPEENGYWALILHMHLPFVRHVEYAVSLEEQWLFEAITSCYAPMLDMFWNLEKDKIDFRMTVSISPPLISMLEDEALQNRYRVFLEESLKLADREYAEHKGKTFGHTLEILLGKLHSARRIFESYGGNILKGYRDFQDLGKIEVITCAGTHPTLPFYMQYPEVIRAHIQMSCRQYERVFGRWPRGMWLPENAYTPGLDGYLAAEGIKWTVVNATGLARGNTRVWHDTARPVVTHGGLAIFGIDEDTRAQVWSREAGYPGDPRYKEWYRDLGFDADWNYLPEYFKTANVRRNTGLKYYRITSKTTPGHEKQPYNPSWAHEAAAEQAGQFVHHRGTQANHLRGKYGQKPITVSAYDAELFGHWWEEGPHWIELVFRKMAFDQKIVRPCTPAEFLVEHKTHQLLTPGMSTWGAKATFETWLDGRAYQPNVWIYRHLFKLIEEMGNLATAKKNAEGIERRALNQAARELMLAQSSDWPFLISMNQSANYAEMRLIKHIDRCRELIKMVWSGKIDDTFLKTLEVNDNLLKDDMDFRVFSRG